MNNIHSFHEDFFSLSIGVLVLSFAVVILKQAGVYVGGIAGFALLISKLFDLGFGMLFFAMSIPFYFMAWFRMSRTFTIKSLLCVGGISWLSDVLMTRISIEGFTPMLAAVIGGVLCGLGLLVLFRHQSSAGGFNVLAIYCQETFGIRAGYLLMALDMTILVITALCFPVATLVASTFCIIILNLVLGFNHKPGRYVAQPRLASS